MLVFATVLLEQAGVPIPCTPWLIASGALARLGHGTAGGPHRAGHRRRLARPHRVVPGGRRWGNRVLRLVCRVSLEPDICVQRTENVFTRHGARALVIAPFVPGLTTLAPPLAGMSGMRFRRFLALDGLGDLLWASSLVVVSGWVAGEPFFQVVGVVLHYAGSTAAGYFAVLLALYLGLKFLQRMRFRTQLRVARLSARRAEAQARRRRCDGARRPAPSAGGRGIGEHAAGRAAHLAGGAGPAAREIARGQQWCSSVVDPTSGRAPGWRSS